MCHQSGGLLANLVEEAGIVTVAITLKPEITVRVRPPRACYVRFPLGMPCGEAGKPAQHRTILQAVLEAVPRFEAAGTVVELPYRWRRMG